MNDEERRAAMEELIKNADPAIVEKFGNPLDKSDPRNWNPSERIERGLSLEEQVRLLGLDVESSTMAFGVVVQQMGALTENVAQLSDWVAEKMKDEFVEKMKTDPEAAVAQLQEMLSKKLNRKPGSWGPFENDPNANVRYAGSAQGMAPDQQVETPDGIIRADQIPGYRNDPNWTPSPDWADANCMCPSHVARREADKKNGPDFGIDPFGPGTGMYL